MYIVKKLLERVRKRTFRPVANFGKHPLVSTYLVFSAKHPWLTESLVSFEIWKNTLIKNTYPENPEILIFKVGFLLLHSSLVDFFLQEHYKLIRILEQLLLVTIILFSIVFRGNRPNFCRLGCISQKFSLFFIVNFDILKLRC